MSFFKFYEIYFENKLIIYAFTLLFIQLNNQFIAFIVTNISIYFNIIKIISIYLRKINSYVENDFVLLTSF